MPAHRERFGSERYTVLRHLAQTDRVSQRRRGHWPPTPPETISLRWLDHVVVRTGPTTFQIRVPYSGAAPTGRALQSLAQELECHWQQAVSTGFRIASVRANGDEGRGATGGAITLLVTCVGETDGCERRLGELARREAHPTPGAG